MNVFNRYKQNLFRRSIDLIEWVVHTPRTVIWHFSPHDTLFKKGARLRVRKGQIAVLVNEGKFADVFQPGEYELTASNMPILATMKGWKRGFNSPFKMDVYFVCTKHFVDIPWVTKEPILMNDKEFGPIHVCAFGSYCFRVHHNPILFIRNVVGTDGLFSTDSVIEQLRKFVIAKFTDYLSESNIAAFDLTKDLKEFSNELTNAMKSDFYDYGIELTKLIVESIALPEVVKAALYKQKNIRSIATMTTYSQMKLADSFRNEIRN